MSTKSWDERITTRYTEPEKDVYEKVIDLVKKNSIPKSTAQLLLVKRGLQHTQNPEPLVKTVKEVVESLFLKTGIPTARIAMVNQKWTSPHRKNT